MSKFEICYLVAMCALIALCLLSHIFVAVFGSRNSKRFFCVVAGVVFIVCVAVFVMLNVKIDFYPALRLYAIKDKLLVTVPAFIATVVSGSELTGLIYSIRQSSVIGAVDSDVAAELVNEKYPMIDNERKAGKAKHRSYKISRDDK